MKLEVIGSSPLSHEIICSHYDIFDGILHTFNEDGSPIKIVKNWEYIVIIEEKETTTPDQFYENLEEDRE